MKARFALILGFLALFVVAAIVYVNREDSGSDYQVRAMFYNAFTIIPGEQVKSAGVPIGTIKSLDVQDRKAAVVLDITDPAFQDFRQDAECQIRPQSLIGERFVECSLTQDKAPGEAEAPALKKIEDGPGKGQLLLPVENTVNPIDIDLVNNTLRLPYRQRLTIILNELGVGLAGNGKAINEAVRAANPTLRSVEKVLAVLAENNKQLVQIAEDGDKALAPLAAKSDNVASAIDSMNQVAKASAERSEPLEKGLETLPAALREIRPTMAALSDLADQLQPVADDLKTSGKDLSRAIVGLGGLGEEGTAAVKELATTLDQSKDALLTAKPVLEDAQTFAKDAKPLADNVSQLLVSLRQTGGFERLMDFFYYSAAAANGYDEDGHYLRAQTVLNVCLPYVDVPAGGDCNANFVEPEASSASTKEPTIGRNRDGSKVQPSKVQRAALPSAILPGAKTDPVKKTSVPGGLGTDKSQPTDGQSAVLDYLMGD